MPDTKISNLTELAEAPASTDEFVIVDKSDTTMSASGTTKKIQSQYVTIADATASTKGKALLVEGQIHGATAKTTPVDADEIGIVDTEASNVLKKLTWANLKATLKTYFDSVTTTFTNKTLTSPVINTPTGIKTSDLQNPYKFSVYRNAAQNVGNGAYGKITFDTELYDTNNNFATGTYTAPVAGFYHFDCTVGFQGLGTVAMALYKNGSIFRKGWDAYNAGNTTYFAHVHCDLELAANDTIEIYVYGDGRAVTTGKIYNYFSGHLVSKT